MELAADCVIFLMTLVGASSTLAAEQLLRTTPPLMLLSLRFLTAAAVLFCVCPRAILGQLRESIRGGCTFGAGFGFGCLFLYLGLPHVHTGHAMFLITMEVVLVPLFSFMFFRDRPAPLEFVSFGVALLGLWIFTGPHNGDGSPYDIVILIGACCYATYTVFLSHFSSAKVYLGQIFVSYCFIAALSGVAALCTGQIRSVQWSPLEYWVFGYFILISTLLRFLGQSWAQRIASPTRTALIFLLEPLFALCLSSYFYGETFSSAKLTGGAVILAASLLATLGVKSGHAAEIQGP